MNSTDLTEQSQTGFRPDSLVLVLAHVLVVFALGVALIGGFRPMTPDEQLLAAMTTLIVTLLAALRIATGVEGGRHGVALWRIGPWYLIWTLFGFGVASFSWTETQQGTSAIIRQESVVTALYAMSVTVVVLTLAYAIGPPQIVTRGATRLLSLSMSGRSVSVSTRSSVPWTLYGIGIGSRLLSLALQGNFGYLGDPNAAVASATGYNQILNVGSTLAVAGVALAAFNVFAGRVSGAGLTLAMLLTIEAGFAVVSGNKEPFVVAGLALLIPYGAARRRLPWKALTIGGLAFLLILLPFNVAYRDAIRSTSGTLSATAAIGKVPSLLAGTVKSDGMTEVLGDSFETLLHRVRLIDGLAIMIQKTPSNIPYSSPVQYLYAPFIGVIPRAVWPGKPLLTAGYSVNQTYYEMPASVVTSSTVTTPGGFYQHGGWISLIVCAFLLGGFLRLLDKLFRPEGDPRAAFFLLVFLPTLIKSEVDSVELVISLPLLFLTGIVAARLASDKVRTGSPEGVL